MSSFKLTHVLLHWHCLNGIWTQFACNHVLHLTQMTPWCAPSPTLTLWSTPRLCPFTSLLSSLCWSTSASTSSSGWGGRGSPSARPAGRCSRARPHRLWWDQRHIVFIVSKKYLLLHGLGKSFHYWPYKLNNKLKNAWRPSWKQGCFCCCCWSWTLTRFRFQIDFIHPQQAIGVALVLQDSTKTVKAIRVKTTRQQKGKGKKKTLNKDISKDMAVTVNTTRQEISLESHCI